MLSFSSLHHWWWWWGNVGDRQSAPIRTYTLPQRKPLQWPTLGEQGARTQHATSNNTILMATGVERPDRSLISVKHQWGGQYEQQWWYRCKLGYWRCETQCTRCVGWPWNQVGCVEWAQGRVSSTRNSTDTTADVNKSISIHWNTTKQPNSPVKLERHRIKLRSRDGWWYAETRQYRRRRAEPPDIPS